jgi:fructoselysine-6-P-deglycase FrlB-like protein
MNTENSMDANKIVDDIVASRDIDQVYWVACGGSLIDLYPAHFLVQTEGVSVTSGAYTAEEFNLYAPKRLGENSLVVVCSHSGKTPECLRAVEVARSKGAPVVVQTDDGDSPIAKTDSVVWVYPWGDDVPVAEVPAGISLLLATRLLEDRDGWVLGDEMREGIRLMDGILAESRAEIAADFGAKFVDFCKQNPFFYILGSGPNYSQTYGFAICSLMEMQWQDCAYIHSGEYFHGPFEVTDENAAYFLQLGSGAARKMDERALAFLKTHTDRLLVLDALDYGMGRVPASARDYLDPVLFYCANVQLRNERGKVYDHHPDVRRYMGVVEY